MKVLHLAVKEEFLIDAYKNACQEWKEKLLKEFPDVDFEPDGKFAIKKGKFNKASNDNLQNFCKEAGLGFSALQVRWAGTYGESACSGRGVYLGSEYDWRIEEEGLIKVLVPYIKGKI